MGIGAGLFGATVAGLWWRLFRQPLARTTGEITVHGLDARVEIARDRWGMPTVRARSAADLWFGQGFCHGQDRLYRDDPHFRELVLFHEYFHGDDGSGVGASHQTGWTGLVAKLLQQSGE